MLSSNFASPDLAHVLRFIPHSGAETVRLGTESSSELTTQLTTDYIHSATPLARRARAPLFRRDHSECRRRSHLSHANTLSCKLHLLGVSEASQLITGSGWWRSARLSILHSLIHSSFISLCLGSQYYSLTLTNRSMYYFQGPILRNPPSDVRT